MFKNFLLLVLLGALLISSVSYGIPHEVKSEELKLFGLGRSVVIQGTEAQHSPYLKGVVMKSQDSFPREFLSQTQQFIDHEENFRQLSKFKLSPNLNIAQFSFYGLYKDGRVKVLGDLSETPDQPVLYLSGTRPYLYQSDSKVEPDSILRQTVKLTSRTKQHQNASGKVKQVVVVQRSQETIRSIETTLFYLRNAEEFIENTTQIKDLLNRVYDKSQEVSQFRVTQRRIIHKLQQMPQPPSLASENELIRQAILSLQYDDVNFNFTKSNLRKSLMDPLLIKVQKKLNKERNVGDVLNSKHINLACSEQLLIYDLGQDVRRDSLTHKVETGLEKEDLESILFHIHSTKAPCLACLVNCCGHLHDAGHGWIYLLMKQIKERMQVPVQFVISYEKPFFTTGRVLVPIPANEGDLSESQIFLVHAPKTG